jgi:hypothetical protein
MKLKTEEADKEKKKPTTIDDVAINEHNNIVACNKKFQQRIKKSIQRQYLTVAKKIFIFVHADAIKNKLIPYYNDTDISTDDVITKFQKWAKSNSPILNRDFGINSLDVMHLSAVLSDKRVNMRFGVDAGYVLLIGGIKHDEVKEKNKEHFFASKYLNLLRKTFFRDNIAKFKTITQKNIHQIPYPSIPVKDISSTGPSSVVSQPKLIINEINNKAVAATNSDTTNNKKSSGEHNIAEIWKGTLDEFCNEWSNLNDVGYCFNTENNQYSQILKIHKILNYAIFENLWNRILINTDREDCLKNFKTDMNNYAYFQYFLEANKSTKIDLVTGNGFCGYTTVLYLLNQNNNGELEKMGVNQINKYWKFDWKCSEYVYTNLNEDIVFWENKMMEIKKNKQLDFTALEYCKESVTKLLMMLNGAKNQIDRLKNEVTTKTIELKDKKEVFKIREECCKNMRLQNRDYWMTSNLVALLFAVRLGLPIMSFAFNCEQYNPIGNMADFAILKGFNSPLEKSLATSRYDNKAFPTTDALISDTNFKNSTSFRISTITKLLELEMVALYVGQNHFYKLNINYNRTLDSVKNAYETICNNLFTGLYNNMCKVYQNGETESLFTSNNYVQMIKISKDKPKDSMMRTSKKTECVDMVSEDDSPISSSKDSLKKRNFFSDNDEITSTTTSSKKFTIDNQQELKMVELNISENEDTVTNVTFEENELIKKLQDLQNYLNNIDKETLTKNNMCEEKFKESLSEYLLEQQQKNIFHHDDDVN